MTERDKAIKAVADDMELLSDTADDVSCALLRAIGHFEKGDEAKAKESIDRATLQIMLASSQWYDPFRRADRNLGAALEIKGEAE